MEQQDWLGQFQRRVDDMRAKSLALQEKLAQASATAQSRNGLVSVTVGPNGGLQDLVINEQAIRGGMSAATLTSTIMETYARAQQKAATEVADALEPLAGNSEMMQVVRSFLPPPDDEDDPGFTDPPEPPPPSPPSPVARPEPPQPPPARRRPSRPDDDDLEMDPW